MLADMDGLQPLQQPRVTDTVILTIGNVER